MENANGTGSTADAKERPLPIIEEQTAGVDWLTVTVKNKDRQELLWREAERLFKIQKERGNVQRPWSFKGYTGYSITGIRYGTRTDGSICMLSGEAASLNWPVLLKWADNCTRVDLAVTINYVTPIKEVASEAYGRVMMQFQGNLPRKYSLVINSEGGETLYVGSRASDQFGRLYDKGSEVSQEDGIDLPVGKMWRYEVEFKQYRAKRIAAELLDRSYVYDTINLLIAGTIYKWFLSRGVEPIYQTDKDQMFSTEVYANISDDETTLRWFSTQVSPSIKRLKDRGRLDEVLHALGLSAD